MGPTTDSSKPEGPGQGREDLRRQLTHFQPARRGTQNASRRLGWRSFARVAHPGCSSRLGLRETRTRSATSDQGPPTTTSERRALIGRNPRARSGRPHPQRPRFLLPRPPTPRAGLAAHFLDSRKCESNSLLPRALAAPGPGEDTQLPDWPISKEGRMRRQRPLREEQSEGSPPTLGGGDAPRQGVSPHTHPLLPWAWGPVALKTQIISLRLPPRESSRSPDPVKLPPHSCTAPCLPTPPWTSLCHNH